MTASALMIDDDRRLLDLYEDYVSEEEGFRVYTTTDADKALEIIEREDIGCVLCDQHLGETKGTDVYRIVSREYPDLPFVLYTGDEGEKTASKAISKGVDDYITKGVSEEHYSVLTSKLKTLAEMYKEGKESKKERTLLSRLDEVLSIIIFDSEMRVVEGNERAKRALGYGDLEGVNAMFLFDCPDTIERAPSETFEVSSKVSEVSGYGISDRIVYDGEQCILFVFMHGNHGEGQHI